MILSILLAPISETSCEQAGSKQKQLLNYKRQNLENKKINAIFQVGAQMKSGLFDFGLLRKEQAN